LHSRWNHFDVPSAQADNRQNKECHNPSADDGIGNRQRPDVKQGGAMGATKGAFASDAAAGSAARRLKTMTAAKKARAKIILPNDSQNDFWRHQFLGEEKPPVVRAVEFA